jgi:hypothetical protein
MAKDNRKGPASRSVGNTSEHKVLILKALNSLQEVHQKGSEVWTAIDKAKKEIESETDEKILLAKRTILCEEFKKEMGSILEEEAKT